MSKQKLANINCIDMYCIDIYHIVLILILLMFLFQGVIAARNSFPQFHSNKLKIVPWRKNTLFQCSKLTPDLLKQDYLNKRDFEFQAARNTKFFR